MDIVNLCSRIPIEEDFNYIAYRLLIDNGYCVDLRNDMDYVQICAIEGYNIFSLLEKRIQVNN